MKKTAIILSVFALAFNSCTQTTKRQTETTGLQDTILVKQRDILDNTYAIDVYSRSYTYYLVAGSDTLDLTINATGYKKDSTFYLRVHHNQPILFANVLKDVEECLPLIKEDFDISKLTSFSFMPPVYYLDLASTLSSEYEHEFGQKNISHDRLNQFLLQSSLNKQLNHFFNPLNKKVKYYGFEKFHLINKENYKKYLPNIDLSAYPDFTLNAHVGVWVELENE